MRFAFSMMISRKSVTALAGACNSCRRKAVNARFRRSSDTFVDKTAPPPMRGTTLSILALAQELLHLANEAVELDRFCIVVVASCFERLFAVPAHGVSCQPDHRHVAHRIVGFNTSGRLPSIHDRKA